MLYLVGFLVEITLSNLGCWPVAGLRCVPRRFSPRKVLLAGAEGAKPSVFIARG